MAVAAEAIGRFDGRNAVLLEPVQGLVQVRDEDRQVAESEARSDVLIAHRLGARDGHDLELRGRGIVAQGESGGHIRI